MSNKTLDKLRQRGTPIELIGSLIAAGETQEAGAAFRTTVLEYVHERLSEIFPGSVVQFLNKTQLQRVADTLEKVIEVEPIGANVGISFLPEQENTVANMRVDGPRVYARLFTIQSGSHEIKVDDHITASVVRLIHDVADRVIAQIASRATQVQRDLGQGKFIFGIVPDLSHIIVGHNDGPTIVSVVGEANISIVGALVNAQKVS